MIITKKRFKQEVAREALKISQAEKLTLQIREQEKRIRRLNTRIQTLETEIMQMAGFLFGGREQGTIRGYYRDGSGSITLLNNQPQVMPCNKECTEP